MFKFKISCLVIIVISVSACATMPNGNSSDTLSYNERITEFNHKTCCIAIDKVKIDKIEVGEHVSFSMAENGSLIKKGSESEIYKIFEIPDSKDVLYFLLRTLTIRDSDNPLRYAVLPEVTILNSDYTVSRKSLINNLLYKHSTIWGDKEHFFLYIKVDKSKENNEKYILVHEATSLVSKTIQFSEAESTWNMVVPMGDMMTSQPIKQGGRKFDIKVLPSGVLGLENITSVLDIPFDNFIFF